MRDFRDRLFARLDRLEHLLLTVVYQEKLLMADLATLQTAVAKDTDIESSAVTLIEGLAAQLKAVATDPAAVQALADQLTASSDNLAAAVAANTAPAPTQPVTQPPKA